MNIEPTTHRFVAVLNKKVESGRVMNALGHMAAGLSNVQPDKEAMRFDNYVDKNGGLHVSISDNPFIVLSSDNSSQIRTLRTSLLERQIPFTDFTSTMVVGTFFEQKQRTSEVPELELDYWGICFFAPDTLARELTKKFSLWR